MSMAIKKSQKREAPVTRPKDSIRPRNIPTMRTTRKGMPMIIMGMLIRLNQGTQKTMPRMHMDMHTTKKKSSS